MKTLIFIADYGTDALATAEVILAIRRAAQQPFEVQTVASRPFSTIHTGFLFDQLQRHLAVKQAKDTVLFLNTDPRIHTKRAIAAAAGAPLIGVKLRNGAIAIGPNAGYTFSFVKHDIRQLITLHAGNGGSQFRSRDTFPPFIARALSRTLGRGAHGGASRVAIPDLPQAPFVLHTDNYGNVKTSYTASNVAAARIAWGDAVTVAFAVGRRLTAKVLPNIFGGKPGELVFAPGSSGDARNPYFEFSVRFNGNPRKTAAVLLGFPDSGTTFVMRKQSQRN